MWKRRRRTICKFDSGEEPHDPEVGLGSWIGKNLSSFCICKSFLYSLWEFLQPLVFFFYYIENTNETAHNQSKDLHDLKMTLNDTNETVHGIQKKLDKLDEMQTALDKLVEMQKQLDKLDEMQTAL
jgi:Tfp pilus assembly protein PilO